MGARWPGGTGASRGRPRRYSGADMLGSPSSEPLGGAALVARRPAMLGFRSCPRGDRFRACKRPGVVRRGASKIKGDIVLRIAGRTREFR